MNPVAALRDEVARLERLVEEFRPQQYRAGRLDNIEQAVRDVRKAVKIVEDKLELHDATLKALQAQLSSTWVSDRIYFQLETQVIRLETLVKAIGA